MWKQIISLYMTSPLTRITSNKKHVAILCTQQKNKMCNSYTYYYFLICHIKVRKKPVTHDL